MNWMGYTAIPNMTFISETVVCNFPCISWSLLDQVSTFPVFLPYLSWVFILLHGTFVFIETISRSRFFVLFWACVWLCILVIHFFICLCVCFSDECLFASFFFLTVIQFCTTFSSSSSPSLSSSSGPAPPFSPPFSLLNYLSSSQAGILLMKEDCMCNVVILAFISLHSTETEAEGLPTRRDSFLPHLHTASWNCGPHLRSPIRLPACLFCIANQIWSHSCHQPLPIAVNQDVDVTDNVKN